jgi:hypothetical protein
MPKPKKLKKRTRHEIDFKCYWCNEKLEDSQGGSHNAVVRATCCEQGMHYVCAQRHRTSTASRTARNHKCLLCRKKLAMNKKETVKRLKKWVQKGRIWAHYLLACRYRLGNGVEVDHAKALALLTVAKDAGSTDAMNVLGEMHNCGQGVPQSFKNGHAWWLMGAKLGNAQCLFNMSNQTFLRMSLDEVREAVDTDDPLYSQEQSRIWLEAAAAQHHAMALINLAQLNNDEGSGFLGKTHLTVGGTTHTITGLLKPNTKPGKWECTVCTVPNDNLAEACRACGITQINSKKMLLEVNDKMSMEEFLQKLNIRVDIKPALAALGVTQPMELSKFSPEEINQFIKDNKLNEVDANRFLHRYNVVVGSNLAALFRKNRSAMKIEEAKQNAAKAAAKGAKALDNAPNSLAGSSLLSMMGDEDKKAISMLKTMSAFKEKKGVSSGEAKGAPAAPAAPAPAVAPPLKRDK